LCSYSLRWFTKYAAKCGSWKAWADAYSGKKLARSILVSVMSKATRKKNLLSSSLPKVQLVIESM
jgi:hypothetical protein